MARELIETRDADDWFVVAVVLFLNSRIYTEEQDLVGGDVARRNAYAIL
jgi:predicted nucleic acid-binding protein